MVRSQAPIRFRGGRGPRHVPISRTPSGRAVPAPRISPPAAAALLRALRSTAAQHGLQVGPLLQQAFTDDNLWAAVVASVEREGTIAQSECALAVMRDHRAKHLLADESSLQQQVAGLQRAIRRRAAECPTFKDLGIPRVDLPDGASYLQFIGAEPQGKLRPTPTVASGQGPLAHLRAWGLWDACPAGVVVFGRAGDRVRAWRKGAGASATAAPPAQLAIALVHTGLVPTATASRPDQFWLTEQQRYMSVREVCRVMGVRDDNPLSSALQRVRCPTNAVSFLGRAIHVDVAKRILTFLKGMRVLPDQLTYASACSGIDTFAAAVHDMWGDAWRYAHAAEPETQPRNVLSDAWGLDPSRIYMDAGAPDARAAEPADLFVLSPECNAFSRRRHDRDAGVIAGGAADAGRVMAFVMAAKAKVVVIENVDEPDAVASISTMLADATAYFWRSQALDPSTHAGVPARRERRFFIGVLRQCAPQWA
jgi:hypothetical protein